jgi:hypothetical protein
MKKLEPRFKEIEFVTSSHSGTLTGVEGIQAIQDFVAAHP